MRNISVQFLFLILFFSFISCKSDKDQDSFPKKLSQKDANQSDLISQEVIYENATENTREELDNSGGLISTSRRNVLTKVVRESENAIVGINVTEVVRVEQRNPYERFANDPFFRRFFNQRKRKKAFREYQVHGLGSGFFISPDGYILTNHHVAGNASKILVTTTDGKKHDAKIIGTDKVSDVALLKVEGSDFPYLKLCPGDDIITGEWAIAFGNPFGLFDLNAKPTVTVGVVSNKGLNFYHEDRVYKDMIQTDAAISSGNSGGPLLNALGEVIGINTMIFTTSQSQKGAGSIGIGWAIPIERVKKIVTHLQKHKNVNRQYKLGMEVRELDEQLAKYLDIEMRDGVVVVRIERNSLADNAGFDPGDVIIEVNDNVVFRDEDYYVNVYDAMLGDTLKFKIIRDDTQKVLSMILKPTK